MLKLAVFASGQGSNLQAIIHAIEHRSLDATLVKVISDNPQAKALLHAQKHGIAHETFIREKFANKSDFEKAILDCLHEAGAQHIALAGYMRIVSSVLLRPFKGRILNIHPSLLPAFPGLNAISQALDYGVKVTGCTVHFVDEGCDTGPIIAQRVVGIDPKDTLENLTQKIHQEEHKLYPEVLQWIAQEKVILEGRKVLLK